MKTVVGTMAAVNKLSVLSAQNAAKPGRYADGGGLYLQVTKSGAKSWLFIYRLNGKRPEMGLGGFPAISLKDARTLAAECRLSLQFGVNPLEERRKKETAQRLEAARALTFDDCAAAYVDAHKTGWKNAKHAQQWPNTLQAYASPVFGSLPVADVDTALVLKALEPIWKTKTETATRVRNRIELVLNWAAARGYRKGENPARWRGHLDKLLPPPSKVKKVVHHAALPYPDVCAFIKALRQRDGTGARAFEFLILSATRVGETIGGRWEEIDMKQKVWTIPAERMKAGREHRVPLTDRMLTLLQEAGPKKQGYVFSGQKPGKPLSNMAFEMVLRRMQSGDITPHGFRSTFRDWASETTGYPREVAEMALAHTIDDKVEAAYRRGDLFEKRRRLMADWEHWCENGPPARADVIPLRSMS